MSLRPGHFIISNKASGLYLGRGINEEASLLPKGIVTLPGGVRAPRWKVERLHDGRYLLAVVLYDSPKEYYATEIDGKVYAILDPDGPVKPTEWTIKHVGGHGPHVHIVEAPSGSVWTVPEKEPYTQVVLDTLIVLGSAQEEIPLPYSPHQLFTFHPAPEHKD